MPFKIRERSCVAASGAAAFRADVVENRPLNENHFVLTFRPQESSPDPEPGQFYMIGTGSTADPLLKRPFCFFDRVNGDIQLLYRVRGRGTELLRDKKSGDLVDVLGPLGNPWPMPPKKEHPLIVAGGVGIASVMPLVTGLTKRATVLYGGRSRDELLMLEELKAVAGELRTSTEDGSHGAKGLVTDLVRGISGENHVIYACGPEGMLKAIAEMARERGLNGYVSLEEHMACGVGACLGCAVMTKKGYKRVCKEGPVFKMGEVVW
jgi:dihydroorotate dehydrogenase electron transfer subunit